MEEEMYNEDIDLHSGGASRFLIGLFIGAAVGAALGMAFAPYPGLETRRRLSESTRRFKNTARRSYEQASSNVNHLLDRSREVLARGQEGYEHARNDARETLGAS